jgi:hypothetical protein
MGPEALRVRLEPAGPLSSARPFLGRAENERDGKDCDVAAVAEGPHRRYRPSRSLHLGLGGPLRSRTFPSHRFRRAAVVSLAVVLGSFACSSSNDECLSTGEVICQKACACNAGTTCRFVQPGAGGTATKSEESCNQYFSDTCGTPALAGVDFAKCAAEANGAQCLTNENAIDGPAKAAQLPDSCATRGPNAVKPDGG